MKFASEFWFLAFIVHVSLSEDVTVTPSSEKAATGETSASSEISGSGSQAPPDSTSGLTGSSTEAASEKSTSTPDLETNDSNIKDDLENADQTGPTKVEGVETEVPIAEREISSELPKETQNPGSNELKSGESKESGASNVEPTKTPTCIISNATHWSWLVKILDKDTGKQICTGTLITDEDILVPASCFMENTTQEVPESFYALPKELMAIAGGGVNNDVCMQIRNISVIYPHKGYFNNSEEHDYAFLKVSPEFDVDDDDIPDIRYHLNVINSEGGLVNIHNNGPFCESPYFVDDGINAKVSDEIHLLGMRIEDCMMIWNCSADFDTCLSYLHPASHACLKPLTPRNCGPRDKGAPLVCDDVFLGYLHQCDGELPMIFRGLNKAIKFLELEDDHVQRPGYMGRHY